VNGKRPDEGSGGTGRIAAHLIQRCIAQDKRNPVDGKPAMGDNHDGGQIIESHIGIDPNTHFKHTPKIQPDDPLGRPYTREIEEKG